MVSRIVLNLFAMKLKLLQHELGALLLGQSRSAVLSTLFLRPEAGIACA